VPSKCPAKDIVPASRLPWTMVPWSNRSCASFGSYSSLTDSAWTTAHEDQEASRVLGWDDNSLPSTPATLDVVTEPGPESEILAGSGADVREALQIARARGGRRSPRSRTDSLQ